MIFIFFIIVVFCVFLWGMMMFCIFVCFVVLIVMDKVFLVGCIFFFKDSLLINVYFLMMVGFNCFDLINSFSVMGRLNVVVCFGNLVGVRLIIIWLCGWWNFELINVWLMWCVFLCIVVFGKLMRIVLGIDVGDILIFILICIVFMFNNENVFSWVNNLCCFFLLCIEIWWLLYL